MSETSKKQFLDKDGVNALWGKTCTTFSPKGHTHDYLPIDGVAIAAKDLVGRHEATYEEFTYRPSAGTKSIKDDNANIKSIYGSSLVWNNLAASIPEMAAYRTNIFDFDGVNTFTVKADTYSNNLALDVTLNKRLSVLNHYYLFIVEGNTVNDIVVTAGSAYPKLSDGWAIVQCTIAHHAIYIYPFGTNKNIVAGTTFTLDSVKLVDLTKMFGAGNEPSTIEEFYTRIPEGVDINAYNEGELINFTAESIKTTGFNQWDEQWELGYIDASGNPVDGTSNIRSSNFIPVIGGATYYSKGGDCIIVCYDENKKFIPYNGETGAPVYTNCINIVNTTFVLPINTRYIKFWMAKTYGATYNNDICINLSHSGVRDGEYEPYKEFTHDLSWIKRYFPNGMRGIGSAYDEIKYDEAKQKWVAIQRIGEVDLGNSDIKYDSARSAFYLILYNSKTLGKGICPKFTLNNLSAVNLSDGEMSFHNTYYNHSVIFKAISYTDVASFKSAMSGVKLYYELAEPIVTTITEILDTNYSVFDFGTEEILVGTTTINNEETGETNIVAIPSTSFKGNIIYAFNAVDRIRDIERNLNSLTDVLDDDEITNIFNEYFVLSVGSGGSGSGDSGDGISIALNDEAEGVDEVEPIEPTEPIETTTEE